MTETSTPPAGSGAAVRAAAARIADPEQRVLERIAEIRKRRPTLRETAITMSHGAGGKASHTLTGAVFASILDNPVLAQLGDQAVLGVPGLDGARLAMTTDSFVVSPLFFPGGDIGELAINGTVNDLAVGGATPLAVSAAFILEEGLDVGVLRRVVESMRRAADAAGVSVVTGDTKVVPRGKADQLFITTTGIGLIAEPGRLGIDRVAAGDAVLLSGRDGQPRRHGHAGARRRRPGGGHAGQRHHGAQRPVPARCSTPASTCTSCATPRVEGWPPCSTRSPSRPGLRWR